MKIKSVKSNCELSFFHNNESFNSYFPELFFIWFFKIKVNYENDFFLM
jgi:hypothetical protein